MIHNKFRYLLTLVALFAMTAGAWAQEETLLTTITPTGDGTYSETTAGAVTVTPAGSFFYSGSSYGWRWDSYGTLTVTANEGYTITRCVFIQQGKNQSVTISEAPFELNFEEWVCLENTSMDGVTSIEVYGTAPAAEETVTLNHSANNTWAIAEMPGYDVELEVEYFNITVPTANTGDIYAGSTTALITAGSTTEEGATMKYLVTATNEQPASTDGFSADVPTAQATAITGPGTYYVWYYLDLESGDDSEISALAVEVTVSAPTYAITANLADDAYWSTFYTEFGNYQAPEGTQVFAVNLTGTALTLTEISDRIVKSGEGVVLKNATTGSITMTLTETVPAGDFSNNSLQGTMTSITNPGNAYVLNKGTNGVGFYKLASGGTIAANKAYLQTTSNAREFFGFGETTGIKAIENGQLTIDNEVYDLQGRRVVNPTKGLYIVNGKKVFINK